MAWNGSDPKSNHTNTVVRSYGNSRLVIICALIAISIAVGFVLFICQDSPEQNQVPDKARKDKMEYSADRTNSNQQIKDRPETEATPQIKTYRDERGILRYEGGARVPRPEDFINPTKIVSRSIAPKFHHRVENEIAALLTCRPGGIIAGKVNYDDLDQDFINSLADKIEISDTDTPRQKAIKEAVIAAKKELAERVKAGESIVTILKESRAELRRMAQYRHEIEKITQEQLHNPNASDEDVKLVFEAANKMLEEKGVAPIRMNALLLQRERLLQRDVNKKSRSKEETEK